MRVEEDHPLSGKLVPGDNAKTIKGTQSYHQFEVDRSDKKFIFVKNISKSEQFKRVKVFKK